jgi:peptidoglycan/xylan/chitin deacetylase (PgdA/CDA1 family)
LDILEKRGIKVTFFVIGPNVVAHPEKSCAESWPMEMRSETIPGLILSLSKLSDEQVSDEITKTQEAINRACGYMPTLMRPPYGAITKRQRECVEKQFGLSVILWSVDPFDWKRPGISVISERILSGAKLVRLLPSLPGSSERPGA